VRNRLLLLLAVLGVIAGLVSAYLHGLERKPQPPVFNPAPNPYAQGIYANGIVESYQSHGENINLYPEVPGTVVRILVAEGQRVTRGTPLFELGDSVHRATVEQLKAQADAALTLLQELKAQPRKEALDVARAQVTLALANLRTSQDQVEKLRRSYEIDSKSVSRDTLDTAENALKVAKANLEVAERQYDLTRAGAWIYDIRNQEKQHTAAAKAYASANNLLEKYTLRAPVDGIVLSINGAVGSYVSPQGAYDTYTQGMAPIVTMGAVGEYLGVRCYIDEILLHRLPDAEHIKAQMFVRGTDIRIPLEYVRTQPYVSPKIQLSNQRTERVDVRVLPVIFRFVPPKGVQLFPGQLVDVYVGEPQK
jgi:HlyD family secretion protein